MDGNARWAKSKALPLSIGHKTGAQNLRKVAKNCIEVGVKYLTVYAFSSENWNRPKKEVTYLMKLLEEYLDNEVKELMENDIKILVTGNLEKLAKSTKAKIAAVEDQTQNNKSLTLIIAFSYGSRQEITDAAKQIAAEYAEKKISLTQIDENFFAKKLYQPEVPNPDLLIRTAGDFRLSNFLLWQAAYAELYFTKVYWPDFSKKDLVAAIKDFNKRDRRYGER
jgi:undecaprenyl diphosphate synthase